MTHWQNLRIGIRFTTYLLYEFRWSITVFWTLVFGGGALLRYCYHHEELTYAKACHSVFLLIFLESSIDFPDEWYLQPLFFVIPIVGLGAVADSVVRMAYLVFAKKSHLPEWNRMAASLYRNHYVVVGVGKVGYRIITELLKLRQKVVAVEKLNESTFLEEVLERGVPVIRGDARTRKVLEQANVADAQSVILATSDDLSNLDSALTARDINPNARIVVRLFDETLAQKFSGAFDVVAISTSQVSAPAFVRAATGRSVYQAFQLAEREVHLVELKVHAAGALVGKTVGEIQHDNEVNIVMHHCVQSGVNVNPGHDVRLAEGDSILVIAPIEQLIPLELGESPSGRA